VAEEANVWWEGPPGERGVAGSKDDEIHVAQAWIGEGVEQGVDAFMKSQCADEKGEG
jgi:hypothetical protein